MLAAQWRFMMISMEQYLLSVLPTADGAALHGMVSPFKQIDVPDLVCPSS